jgi:glutathione-regulated potassium-efflux system protein KefB
MALESSSADLIKVVTLLGAAVIAVPLFKRIGLGSVLGYLAAGLAIGPFGLKLVDDAQTIIHVAELGVVMFLFVIGLEMKPSHLWDMRHQIFGLGTLQIAVCSLLLTSVGVAFGYSLTVSFISAMGFVLTSTAIVMQLLAERGDITHARGQKMVGILLFEDLLIVPLLALVAFLAPEGAHPASMGVGLRIIVAAASLAALVAAGLWLLNPLFRILANAKAREVMTAAALLVVLGSALLMELGGLSMAMGAFVAGVLLSESSFRHQLEADIEPFRGLLLGLFFLGVGMALDLNVVTQHWTLILAGVVTMMLVKGICIYGVARATRSSHADALDRALIMAQGGEFAFVLLTAALAQRVISPEVNANMTAIIVLSMAFTPLVVAVYRAMRPASKTAAQSMEGVEAAHKLHGKVLVIGFGRVGQIAVQGILSHGGSEISIIDKDTEVIRDAAQYGFKVYYGDGERSDVLRAAGAHHAQAIVVCVDDKTAATRIVENARRECLQTKVLVRAWDREHALALVQADADVVIRETFESAMLLSREAVLALGATEEEADAAMQRMRTRDAERFALETAGGMFAGRELVLGNMAPQPRE